MPTRRAQGDPEACDPMRESRDRPDRRKCKGVLAQERELTSRERDILIGILEESFFEGARDLERQISHTRVTGGLPLFLDLSVNENA